jgi:NTE family protein
MPRSPDQITIVLLSRVPQSSHRFDTIPMATLSSASLAPEKSQRHGVALCLSGGGYRAALFHLGALRRLDELGVLPRITTISSVSGGSIVNAMLATRLVPWPAGANDKCFKVFADDLRGLTSQNIRWIPSYHWVERAYRKQIGSMSLGELPTAGPRFVFCATDLNNGTSWVFEPRGRPIRSSRWRTGSWQAGYAPADQIPLARAVAASSSFPPVLGPVALPIDPTEYKGGKSGGIRKNVRLSDGGVYDNLGLEPVWKAQRTILVSDGGSTVQPAPYTPWKPWRRYGRYLSVADGQGDSVRKRWLIASYDSSRHDDRSYSGTYFGIRSDPGHYKLHPDSFYDRDLVQEIAAIRTDLDVFSDAEAEILQNAGYLICDAAIRTWADELAEPTSPPPKPPYPDYMTHGAARGALAKLRKSRKRHYPFGRFFPRPKAIAHSGNSSAVAARAAGTPSQLDRANTGSYRECQNGRCSYRSGLVLLSQ